MEVPVCDLEVAKPGSDGNGEDETVGRDLLDCPLPF